MAEFVELEEIHDPKDGIVFASITYKIRNNGERQYSFSFFRSYDVEGERRKTCWLGNHHMSALSRILPMVRERLLQLEEKDRLAQNKYSDTWESSGEDLKDEPR